MKNVDLADLARWKICHQTIQALESERAELVKDESRIDADKFKTTLLSIDYHIAVCKQTIKEITGVEYGVMET